MNASRWRPFSRRSGGRAAVAGARRDLCLSRNSGRTQRLQGDLPFRRRRRRRLARLARPRHQQPGRRADRRAAHHRRLHAAAAGRRRHRLRRIGVQHRAHRQVADKVRRRRDAHRGPGRCQALRASSRQGARFAAGDGRPHQGGRRRANRCGLRHHGAHRRARRRRTGRGNRPRAGLRRGGRGHDLPGGDHRAFDVPEIRRRRRRADPRQPDRIRPDAAVHYRRDRRCRRRRSRSIRCPRSAR